MLSVFTAILKLSSDFMGVLSKFNTSLFYILTFLLLLRTDSFEGEVTLIRYVLDYHWGIQWNRIRQRLKRPVGDQLEDETGG